MMFRPTVTAILCALGLSIVTVQAGEDGDLRDFRISQYNEPIPAQGIENNQLAADTRIMARVPGAHEAYGWRYPDAFESSPALMKTRLEQRDAHRAKAQQDIQERRAAFKAKSEQRRAAHQQSMAAYGPGMHPAMMSNQDCAPKAQAPEQQAAAPAAAATTAAQ